MEPIYFMVAILGCADGGTQCADARLLPARYATVAQCRAQLTTVLSQNMDLDFPTVSADCRPQGAAVAKLPMAAKPKG
jgi:hypothetical protein